MRNPRSCKHYFSSIIYLFTCFLGRIDAHEHSTKNVIKATLNANQTAIKASIRSVGFTLGFAFVGILVATILEIDGITAIIGGTIILFADRRRDKHNPLAQHHGGPIG